jgi:hypothetical protein
LTAIFRLRGRQSSPAAEEGVRQRLFLCLKIAISRNPNHESAPSRHGDEGSTSSKFEIRNPKQIQNGQTAMLKTPSPRPCFEF